MILQFSAMIAAVLGQNELPTLIVKTQPVTPDPASHFWVPAIVVPVLSALLSAAVSFFVAWWVFTKQSKENERARKDAFETARLNWIRDQKYTEWKVLLSAFENVNLYLYSLDQNRKIFNQNRPDLERAITNVLHKSVTTIYIANQVLNEKHVKDINLYIDRMRSNLRRMSDLFRRVESETSPEGLSMSLDALTKVYEEMLEVHSDEFARIKDAALTDLGQRS